MRIASYPKTIPAAILSQLKSDGHYNDKIQKNSDWLFAGAYADDGISGTGTAKRDEFNRLIADCDAGKIDLIITKSVSRFARNMVDSLSTIRQLKENGTEVFFEKENIKNG